MSTHCLFGVHLDGLLIARSLVVEVVLAVLLPKFSFELSDQPITWNSSAVNYPTMGEENSKPEMLLKVKAL